MNVRRASSARRRRFGSTTTTTMADGGDLILPVRLDAAPNSGIQHAVARPSVAENVAIPAHLVQAVSGRNEWTPDPQRRRESWSTRTDPRENFDIVRMAQQHVQVAKPKIARANSISIGGLGRSTATGQDSVRANAFAIAGARVPLRKTSMPTLSEKGSHDSFGHAGDRSSGDTKFSNSSGSGQSTDRLVVARDAPPVPLVPIESLPDSTIMYRRLTEYTMTSNERLRQRYSDLQEHDPLSGPMYMVIDEKSNDMRPHDVDPMVAGGLRRSSTVLSRIQTRAPSIVQVAADTIASAVQNAAAGVSNIVRRSSLQDVYEKAKVRGVELQRKKWVQILFEYFFYFIILCFVYFVLIGRPIWNGAVWWLYWVVDTKFVVAGTWSITIGLAIIYAFAPLLILFETEPPMPEDIESLDPTKTLGVHNTALLIPCYKSANIIGPTLKAALKIFPAHHIYVIANGNSPTPLDNTEEVCRPYGVNHIWSPVGSKIVAQFVGCYAAKEFTNVLLIDDDCALPANFPIVSDRMVGKVKCIGYTIKSVGPESSIGNLCQQAQDLEYKISGLQRALAGMIGSATFPHGAISLWDTKFLIKTFHTHPGFSVSEDWFFGHVARKLGCRIKMCTAIFVETETPNAVLFSSGGARGGFGEMTIFKQRFYRWNFFFVNGMYYNMAYILGSWKLGFWEIGAKIFVFQEVYETLLYLLAPFVLPISFIVRPAFCGYLMAGTFALYFVNVTIFNELHLRLRKERVGWVCMYIYYMPYKIVLTIINVFSCYWSLYKYARYFAKRHPKVIEDEKAVEVVLRLEESSPVLSNPGGRKPSQGRRMTVTAVGTRLNRHGGKLSIASVDLAAEARLTRPPPARLSPRNTRDVDQCIYSPNNDDTGFYRVHPAEHTLPAESDAFDFALQPRRLSVAVEEDQPDYPEYPYERDLPDNDPDEMPDDAPRVASGVPDAYTYRSTSLHTSRSSLSLSNVPARPFHREFDNTAVAGYIEDRRKVRSARSMV